MDIYANVLFTVIKCINEKRFWKETNIVVIYIVILVCTFFVLKFIMQEVTMKRDKKKLYYR